MHMCNTNNNQLSYSYSYSKCSTLHTGYYTSKIVSPNQHQPQCTLFGIFQLHLHDKLQNIVLW